MAAELQLLFELFEMLLWPLKVVYRSLYLSIILPLFLLAYCHHAAPAELKESRTPVRLITVDLL